MEFDYDILKSFIPEEDKEYFLVFESVNLLPSGFIRAPYRAPFTNNMKIPLEDYERAVRNKKLKELGI